MAFERPSWLPPENEPGSIAAETAILRFWRENGIFRKSLELREGRPRFVFYEGPPTANGRPHPGHVLTRVMKDVFPRYRTMTGWHVPRKAGWDTHGLPVEIEVEKELGLHSKEDIERYGVEPFVKKCMDSVFRYTRDWEELTERIGFWVDLGDAYVTYRREYVESVWWAVKRLWEKGLLYRGHKIVPWCPRCGTALSSHEVGWGYKEVGDPSVVVKFRVTRMPDGSRPAGQAYLLAWTTTPWTLLSNVALAVRPDAIYEAYRHPELTAGELWIAAEERWRDLAPARSGSGCAPEWKLKGAELSGCEYEPLYMPPAEMLEGKRAHYVVAAEFVGLDEGTGIVHIAPAFGAEDSELGREHDLPVVTRVDPQGRMTADTGPAFAGKFCKEADKDIIRDLKERGLLVRHETLRHEYPFCWRCDTPLLYYPREAWFIRTTRFRERMLELNGRIGWFPGHIREGRFGNFLRDNVDWALSRERYWGTPLNLWRCERCGHIEAAEGLDWLRTRPGASGFELFEEARRRDPSLSEHLAIHKPYIDAVTYSCAKCGSTARRASEVLDCWFDSGSMPFAQWGYPARPGSRERFERAFPADFISEAIDQTRGWFYSLHAISTMLFDAEAFKNCIVLGHVCDEKGAKMSKSKGNYVEPKSILDSQGADALRWYFLSGVQPWNSLRFSERAVAMASKDFLIKLRNVFQFFLIYARIDGFDPARGGGPGIASARPSTWGARAGRRPPAERSALDRWILGEIALTIRTVREALDAYDSYRASQALAELVEGLSNWYLRRSRNRFWGSGLEQDKLDAYWTLFETMSTIALLVAPFTPFVAEEMYQRLVRAAWPASAPASVHLDEYPSPEEFPVDERLARGMALAREAAALGRAARAEAKLRVRMPLSEAIAVAPDSRDAELLAELAGIVSDELNAKRLWVARRDPKQVRFTVKPDYKRLGPRLGAKLRELEKVLASLDGAEVRKALRETGRLAVEISGERLELEREDLELRAEAAPGYAASSGQNLVVILNTELTEELRLEGLAREVVSRIQAMRKDMGLPYEARIETWIGGSERVREAVARNSAYVAGETLSARLLDSPPPMTPVERAELDGEQVEIAVRRV